MLREEAEATPERWVWDSGHVQGQQLLLQRSKNMDEVGMK
jgi:hypothetical protein